MGAVGVDVVVKALGSVLDAGGLLDDVAAAELSVAGAQDGIAAENGVLFEYGDGAAGLGGLDGGAEPGIAGADDEDVDVLVPGDFGRGGFIGEGAAGGGQAEGGAGDPRPS